jgi:hypothetical protein
MARYVQRRELQEGAIEKQLAMDERVKKGATSPQQKEITGKRDVAREHYIRTSSRLRKVMQNGGSFLRYVNFRRKY